MTDTRKLLEELMDGVSKHDSTLATKLAWVQTHANAVASELSRLRALEQRLAGDDEVKLRRRVEEATIAIGGLLDELEEITTQRIDFSRAVSHWHDDKVTEIENRQVLEKHSISDRVVRVEVWKKTNGKCAYCSTGLRHPYEDEKAEAVTKPVMHVDHVMPRSRGGPDHILNYAPSCPPCNMSKSEKDVTAFIAGLRRVSA